MFEGSLGVIIIAVFGAVAFGGIAWVVIDPFISGERRMSDVITGEQGARVSGSAMTID